MSATPRMDGEAERALDAAAEAAGLARVPAASASAIEAAMDTLVDPEAPLPNRAALYALLQVVQLRINRTLRKVKADLAAEMVRADMPSIGPVSAVWQARDVTYPCNDEGNWQDVGVQDAMRDVILPVAPEFVRHVPDHYEIRTAELGKAVAAGDPLALQVWRELDQRKWRVAARRDLVLKVRER